MKIKSVASSTHLPVQTKLSYASRKHLHWSLPKWEAYVTLSRTFLEKVASWKKLKHYCFCKPMLTPVREKMLSNQQCRALAWNKIVMEVLLLHPR